MFEFNPDGSLKLPSSLFQAKKEKEEKMKKETASL